MKTETLIGSIAERLMRQPAAPYHEAGVAAAARRICGEHGLIVEEDPSGNLQIPYRRGAKGRPLALAAHMDHPGFEIIKAIRKCEWIARFLGGVPDRYFKAGTRLRLMPGGESAILGKRVRHSAEKRFLISAKMECDPRFAVWELPDFQLRGGRIRGRACDDLIGVAAILATLIELKRSRANAHVIGVISRAEEVGFHGALAVATSGALPKDSLVISLETSRELPAVKMGKGVIVRAGDKASVFDSAATRFLGEVASQLQSARPRAFQFQRALMGGGTCEATAYQEFGYQTAAVCAALGNYHNCGARDRIRAEYVSVFDAVTMVALLREAAKQMPRFGSHTSKLSKRLRGLLRESRRSLRAR